ncbi:hypothetical protein [Pumilibacter intestinalis]|uniref:hypothetical protein n=1 Tax=Pumilibacter intestinalis TaxID=2941511 RepID=UPI0020409453|nr:hypothetical protein [Pumilibacter intestinalis]
MGFFTLRHKKLAKKYSLSELKDGYRYSENELKEAAENGDIKAFKRAMKVHGNFEYAMLYKNTPEYNKRRK